MIDSSHRLKLSHRKIERDTRITHKQIHSAFALASFTTHQQKVKKKKQHSSQHWMPQWIMKEVKQRKEEKKATATREKQCFSLVYLIKKNIEEYSSLIDALEWNRCIFYVHIVPAAFESHFSLLCALKEMKKTKEKIRKNKNVLHASCYFISVILAHLSFNSIFIRFDEVDVDNIHPCYSVSAFYRCMCVCVSVCYKYNFRCKQAALLFSLLKDIVQL